MAVPVPWRSSRAIAQHGRLLDSTGLALAGALVVWVGGVGNTVGGDGLPLAALVTASLAVFVTSRWVAGSQPALVPLIVVVTGVMLWLLPGAGELLGTNAAGRPYGPLVYANATGSLYLLVAIASVSIATGTRRPGARLVAVLLALASASVALGSGSVAVPVLGAVALALLMMGSTDGGGPVAVVGAAVVLAAVIVTVGLGAAFSPQGPSEGAVGLGQELLSERRLVLWHESLEMISADPLLGVGPGRFADHSATAQEDSDVSTPHNGYLLVASELGIVGAGLVVGLLLWGFAALHASGRPRDAAVGAAALSALGLHASVDYVARSPLVVLVVVALVAVGSVRRRAHIRAGDT